MSLHSLSPASRFSRTAVAVLVSIVALAGCSRSAGETPDATPSPSVPTDTSTDASPDATGQAADYSTTGCEDPPADFELLCEVTELIRTRYVDPPSNSELAAAAAGALEAGPGSEEGFTCALPDQEFRTLCDALAQAGGPDDASIEAAVLAMVQSELDPNSAYLDQQQYERSREDQSGQVEGIGALVTTEDRSAEDPEASRCTPLSDTCHLVIVSVFEGAPADRAGLEAGDVIVNVNGEDVAGRTIDDVVDEVRGPAGTDVELVIQRADTVRTFTITRAAVDIPVIESASVDDTAYLRLALFTGDADERLESALRQLLEADPSRIVLDLRSNPGGSLDAAVEIASEFLSDGLVLRTESPDGTRDYEVRPGGLATDPSLEVIVLVDRGSASASEVVAAALHEAGRATVVGERTFGKDTVQQTFPLESGGGALKLTIAQWVTPDGDGFGEGIEPDVTLRLPIDAEPEQVVKQVLEATG